MEGLKEDRGPVRGQRGEAVGGGQGPARPLWTSSSFNVSSCFTILRARGRNASEFGKEVTGSFWILGVLWSQLAGVVWCRRERLGARICGQRCPVSPLPSSVPTETKFCLGQQCAGPSARTMTGPSQQAHFFSCFANLPGVWEWPRDLDVANEKSSGRWGWGK